MGGRGSGGGKGGGGAAAKAPKNIGEGLTDKNELIRLYNSISGNPAYSIDQRVREMEAIRKRIDELDAKKAADLKQNRLDALAKARAKRAENLKNGVKPEKKPRTPKAKMSMDSTVSNLKDELLSKVSTDGYIRRSDFRVEDYGDFINVSVRSLGKWKNPSDARGEEDYDWQVLHKSSRAQIDKVVNRLAKKSGRKLSWSQEEKNWIGVDIPKMKGD